MHTTMLEAPESVRGSIRPTPMGVRPPCNNPHPVEMGNLIRMSTPPYR